VFIPNIGEVKTVNVFDVENVHEFVWAA